jgi:hypothetical protein
VTRRDWLKKNPPPADRAQCPTHRQQILRHNNRAEDLFVCSVGPHYLLWGPVAGGPAKFAEIDIAKELPDLDKPIG